MPDPLSITSGIAGFLSLGIQVTQSLVDFYTTYKGQDTDLAKITRKLDDLQTLFRALESAVEKRRSQPNTQDLLQEVEKAVQKCEEIIIELQSECEKFHSDPAASLKDRVKVAGRRAAYPFRKSTLQKLEEDINEIRENLSFGIEILQLKGQTQVQDSISEIKSLVERTNASQVSFELRCWLMAPDASLNHNAAWAKSHPGTGLWFVNGDQFRAWLQKHNSFLWLNGFAGCGKSVLCSTAIQHTFHEMRHEDNVGIAFFYFSFSDNAKQDADGMLRTLLLQLSVQVPDGEKDLEQLYKLNKSGSPPVNVLLNSLHGLLKRFRDAYILLDALDESPREPKREGVLNAIQVIRDWSIPGLHLLVTSRNELDIRESLNPSCVQDIPLRNPETDKDIANFVSYQLKNDTKLQRWKERHAEIQEKLAADARGVFRYVECQFNAFRRVRNRNQLDDCLRTLPRDLDETYERMLCSIADEYVDDVRRVLTLLCFSARPLTIDELIDAHAVDLNEPPHLDRDGRSYEQNDLIDICLGLVEVVAATVKYKGTSYFEARIAHFSVQEYLQSDRILQQKSKGFAMRSAPANTEIAQLCLVYLLDPTLSEVAFDENPSEEELHRAKLINHTRLREDFPFVYFAAKYWLYHHARSEDGKITIEKLASKIFIDQTNPFDLCIYLEDQDALAPYIRNPCSELAAPLYYAALCGLEDVLHSTLPVDTTSSELFDIVNAQVQLLLDRGADIHAQGGKYGNALQAAAAQGHKEIVQILLDRGADINAQGGKYGNALQAAASQCHKEVVQILLDRGADIHAQGGLYGNALQAAAARRHEEIVQKEIVQLLLDRGADINAQGGCYGNALQAAAAEGYKEILQILLDRGADINAQGGYYGNALRGAAAQGHKEIVQILLDRGADINAQDGQYGNALQAAALGAHKEAVQVLLDRGADVNAQGVYGNALQAAAVSGHKEIVQILLNRGADINAQGGYYGNALQVAVAISYIEIVEELLYQGADINAQGGYYGNALQAAAAIGYGELHILQILLDRGADVNAQGGYYGNALQAAASKSSFHKKEVVQILLDRGADVNAQGGKYGNALQAAEDNGCEDTVEILLGLGAYYHSPFKHCFRPHHLKAKNKWRRRNRIKMSTLTPRAKQ
ncbi:NACHT nucleoside triphosphatase [Penicillium verhagenii]|nr:NACHT nucleoside triphosphatase [Penicillium verhagenii]